MRECMKNRFKIVTALVLALSIFLAAVGCNDGKTQSAEELYDPHKGIGAAIDTFVGEDGSDYKILLSETATVTEYYAATEFQKYINEATGVLLDIVYDDEVSVDSDGRFVSIGKTKLLESAGFDVDYDQLNCDGFFIKTLDKNMYIDGDSTRSVIYGVYDYLEKIVGVKFLTTDCIYVPELSGISLYEMDVLEIPAFAMRDYHAWAVVDSEDPFFLCLRMTQDTHNVEERYGGATLFESKGQTVHTIFDYVSLAKYNNPADPANYHPEFFYFFNGEPWEICWTNGITEDGKLDETMEISVAKVVIESMKQKILASPDARYFMFGMGDFEWGCTCENCKTVSAKYKWSGLHVRFANVIMQEIKEWEQEYFGEQSDRSMVIFAYKYTEEAPVKTVGTDEYEAIDETVIPRDDVVIRIGSLNVDAYYSYTDERQDKFYRDNLKAWGSIANRFMYWGYDNCFQQRGWYYPTMQGWKDTLTAFEDMGFEYVMLQGESGVEFNDWQAHMKAYVASKMLWNPHRNVSEIVDEFLYYYYGETGAECMREFLDYMDDYYLNMRSTTTDTQFAYDNYENVIKAENYSIMFLEKAVDIIEKGIAEVQASDSLTAEEKEDYCKKLLRVKITPQYMILYNYDKYYVSGKLDYATALCEECDYLNYEYIGSYWYDDFKKAFNVG